MTKFEMLALNKYPLSLEHKKRTEIEEIHSKIALLPQNTYLMIALGVGREEFF